MTDEDCKKPDYWGAMVADAFGLSGVDLDEHNSEESRKAIGKLLDVKSARLNAERKRVNE